MAYELFLFDLDDTLLDFRASETLAFARALEGFGIHAETAQKIYPDYQAINHALWQAFEAGQTSKEHLKVERFRQTFARTGVELDPVRVSAHYLETLSQTVVLIDHAEEICAWLSERGEIGIITNGIEAVQHPRIKHSAIAPYISFVSVSEACGFAKPDPRFFEHTVKMASRFSKPHTLIVGDRMEADIQGAHNFGIDGCWFNPSGVAGIAHLSPKYEIRHLSELQQIAA